MPEAEIFDLDPRAIMLLPTNDERRIAFEAAVAERLRVDREAHAARLAAEPVRSVADCRAALRAAVEKHNTAARRLADLTKAMPAADAAVVQSRRNVEAATEAVEKAKADGAAYATARALGTVGTAPTPLRNARLKLTDAEDALEIARTSARDLAQEHKETEQALSSARWDVDRAVAAVVRADAATKALFAEFERARQRLADLRQAVELVAFHFPQMERLALLSERVDNALPSERRAQWEAALGALQEDADAALPI
jgi:predicted  nucleic acid-binding Zn-ribbon protein